MFCQFARSGVQEPMAVFPRFRFALPFLTALAVTGLLSGAASAQGFGFFGNFFGGPARQQQFAPGYNNGFGGHGWGDGDGYAPRRRSDSFYYEHPHPRTPRRKPTEQVQKEKPAPKDASMFIYVLGDSLAQSLAQGLDLAFADRRDVEVVDEAHPTSGLLPRNGFDWSKGIDALLANVDATRKVAPAAGGGKPPSGKDAIAKVDVAVMMVGSSDHQPLDVDGRKLQPGTPEWNAAYAKRVLAVDEAFRAKKIPLVWVGVPIAKDDDFADAMAALNDIYRDAAAKTGAVYVDTWEAFSDDDGDFSPIGPDINGQTTKLRAADGINFTKAGARKLAHFVEIHVRRALDGRTPVPQLPTALDAQKPEQGAKPAVAARPDAGPIRNLNEMPSTPAGTLAAANKVVPAAVAAELPGREAPPGRADDAHWPGKSPDDLPPH